MAVCRLSLLVFMVLSASPSLLAGERGSRAEYIGGTVPGLPEKLDGSLSTTDPQSFLFRAGDRTVSIPYSQIELLEYGQKVDRRYAMAVVVSPLLLLSKKRQHFLTIGYIDEAGRRQAMVFRVAKGDIRAVLVSLEVKTGRKVQYQDPKAREAGKG